MLHEEKLGAGEVAMGGAAGSLGERRRRKTQERGSPRERRPREREITRNAQEQGRRSIRCRGVVRACLLVCAFGVGRVV